MRKDAIVVCHVYKPFESINANEQAAIDQMRKVFKRDITYLAPPELQTASYGSSVIRYPDQFFTYVGYNNLLKSKEFYQTFIDLGFTYLVIVQPDVWVFEDRLNYFLEEFDKNGYDYIGAPWYGVRFCKDGMVGNGGFCIRRLSTFRDICQKYSGMSGNEDTAILMHHRNELKIAPEKLALEFSWEEKPAYAYNLNGGELPMGSHAYASTPDRIGFWRHFIPGIEEIKAKVGSPFTYFNKNHVIGENDQ